MSTSKRRDGFGAVRKLPSGRWQASHVWQGRRVTARTPEGGALTFQTRQDATAWLASRQTAIALGEWPPPVRQAAPRSAPRTFASYSADWLSSRDLAGRTPSTYRGLLRNHLLPAFGSRQLDDILADDVRAWYARAGKTGKLSSRSKAYALMHAIYATAVDDELIARNPCRITGALKAPRRRAIKPATLTELRVLVDALPERYRTMILMAAWCQMRFGELAELRRRDLDLEAGVVRIRRAVVRADGQMVVKAPKSEAGKRDVTIPPHLLGVLRDHLARHTGPDAGALVWPAATDPAKHISQSSVEIVFYRAREIAGRPDLRFHDLRHTGATMAAATGATIRDLMSRLGHSSPAMAMAYQHATDERDRLIADALSALATGDVVTLQPRAAS